MIIAQPTVDEDIKLKSGRRLYHSCAWKIIMKKLAKASFFHAAALTSAVVAAQSSSGNGNAKISWKNQSVSFSKYKKDAVECGKVGYLRDVSNDEPAKRFIRGFRTADDNLNRGGDSGSQAADNWSDTVRRTQPSRRLKEVHDIQVSDVEKCLVSKGYEKFSLSKYEEYQLSKYAKGSEKRKKYLYSLAQRK